MGQASARGISWIDPRTRGRAEVADPSGLEAAHVSAHGGRGLVPVRVTVAWATPPHEEGRAGRGGGQRGSRLRARGGVATPDAGEPGGRPVALRGPRPARHPGRTECAYDPRRERESGSRDAPAALLLCRSGGRGRRPARPGHPSRLVRCLRPDMTWPVAPGCLSRPTGLRRRGVPHPGSHSGGTPSFARATDLGLPKTLGRLGKGSVIGFPNPRESSRPAVTTM